MTPQTATPMLDKMRDVKEKSQAIGEFIEWLRAPGHEHSVVFATWCEDRECPHREALAWEADTEHLHPSHQHGSIEKLLAAFFDINLDAANDEKRALLKELAARSVLDVPAFRQRSGRG